MGLLDKLKQTCPCEHGWALLNARLDRHTRCSKLSDLIAIAICDSHRDSRTLNRTIFCSDGGPVPVRLPAAAPGNHSACFRVRRVSAIMATVWQPPNHTDEYKNHKLARGNLFPFSLPNGHQVVNTVVNASITYRSHFAAKYVLRSGSGQLPR